MTTHDLPALRDFFRGYLHQDTLAEYGGALAAAAQFRADAEDARISTVQQEFARLRSAVNADDLTAINAEVERHGAAYQFASVREWREFSDLLLGE
jgi:contact-dependent growth inhibition (CDI) system CdiI-like immunity protein